MHFERNYKKGALRFKHLPNNFVSKLFHGLRECTLTLVIPKPKTAKYKLHFNNINKFTLFNSMLRTYKRYYLSLKKNSLPSSYQKICSCLLIEC